MEVQLIGHATILLKDKNFSLVCDPWLEGGHVCNCTVWQYPPRITSTKNFNNFDCMYISHDHEDHCNFETLQLVNKDTPIYILNFENNKNLIMRLNELRFKNITVVEPWKKTKIAKNTSITIFPSDLKYADSSALIDYKDFSIYHGNDNVLKPSTLEKIGKLSKINIAFLPYAGLSGFPISYEFSFETKKKFAEKKKKDKLDAFYENVRSLNAEKSVPAAGDLCFVGNNNEWANYFDRASPIEVINFAPKDIKDKILDMRPNDIYSAEKGFIPSSGRDKWNYIIEDQKKFAKLPYVQKELKKYEDWLFGIKINNNNFKKLVFKYFETGLAKYSDIAKSIGNYIFTLQSSNEKNLKLELSIDFNTLKISDSFNQNYSKKFIIRPEILCRIIRREFLWSDAYCGLRMRLDRRPANNYNLNFWKWIYVMDSMKIDYKEFFIK